MTQHIDSEDFLLHPLPFQTPGEEIANSILHGLGALLSVAGLIALIAKTEHPGRSGEDTLTRTAYVIFTAAMVIMFLASTLYHAVQHEGAKRVLRVIDHSAIYLLIAGTYTPFCLLGFKGPLGWAFLAFEWILAIAGITLYAVNWTFIKKSELTIHILMGWAIVAGWIPLSKSLSRISQILLIGGGILYTMGTFWYSKPQRKGAHVKWHIFVLGGATCHWGSVWFLS
ncbi:MAG: hemolysin III family protein [Treponema sp.]|jgi:hemolysin III|nr:hemolysin III family protein [Treponema sp.]